MKKIIAILLTALTLAACGASPSEEDAVDRSINETFSEMSQGELNDLCNTYILMGSEFESLMTDVVGNDEDVDAEFKEIFVTRFMERTREECLQ